MPPVTTASALGQRHFPDVADIPVGAARHRLLSPVLLLVWALLRRILLRLDRLAACWQQGCLHLADNRVRAERKPEPELAKDGPKKPRAQTPRASKPPRFAEHAPAQWPRLAHQHCLRVPGLIRRKPPD